MENINTPGYGAKNDIYEALREDHREFDRLINQAVEFSRAGSDQWKRSIEQLRDGLIPHAHAEEAVFYNALRESDQGKGLVMHSYAEHAMAETELRAILAMKAIDANWTAAVEKLKKDLTHHVEEEEGKVFAAARKLFSDEEARQIGEAFLRLKPEMAKDATSMVASTMDLIANMLPKRISETFRKNFGSGRKSAA